MSWSIACAGYKFHPADRTNAGKGVVLPGLLKKLVVDVYLEYVPRHQALVTLTAGSVALELFLSMAA